MSKTELLICFSFSLKFYIDYVAHLLTDITQKKDLVRVLRNRFFTLRSYWLDSAVF